MPKLGCPCGFVHNLSAIPDDGWNTIPDADMDEPADRKRVGLLYECPKCGRIMWSKLGSDNFQTFLPAESSQHFQALVLAAAADFEHEQEIVKMEAIRAHNEAARLVAQRIKKQGLRCPHCLVHSFDMQFVERLPTDWSFFQCPTCSQTFRLERFHDPKKP